MSHSPNSAGRLASGIGQLGAEQAEPSGQATVSSGDAIADAGVSVLRTLSTTKLSVQSSSSSLSAHSPASTSYPAQDATSPRHASAMPSRLINQPSYSGSSSSPFESDSLEDLPVSTSFGGTGDVHGLGARHPASGASLRKGHVGHYGSSSLLAHKDSFGGLQGFVRTLPNELQSDPSAYAGDAASVLVAARSAAGAPERSSEQDAELVADRHGEAMNAASYASTSAEPVELIGNTLGRNQPPKNGRQRSSSSSSSSVGGHSGGGVGRVGRGSLSAIVGPGAEVSDSLRAAAAAATTPSLASKAGADGSSTLVRAMEGETEQMPGAFDGEDGVKALNRAISRSQSLAVGLGGQGIQTTSLKERRGAIRLSPSTGGLSQLAAEGGSSSNEPPLAAHEGPAGRDAREVQSGPVAKSSSTSLEAGTVRSRSSRTEPSRSDGKHAATSSRERTTRDRDRDRSGAGPLPSSSRHTSSSAHHGKGDASSTATRSVKSSSSRVLPQLPCAPNVKPAPPPAMYWSKVPVHGSVPRRSFRAHTANLSEEVLWLFGGCDNKGCFRDLWCFDTETMCWSKPKVTGEVPPARRAHSATMVDQRLFVFAGGDGPHYFNDLYVFDTVSLRWSKPEVYGAPPSPRRAHTCNYHEGQLIVFGGGNGVGALNDVHTLDVANFSKLEWRKLECRGKIPIGRGYHTTNLVDGKLIVIGGSDGHMSFNDIHILRLDTRTWYQVKTDEIHNRLGHTATQVGSYLFVFGGHDSKTYTDELLTLNLVNLQWEPRRVCGSKPPGRGYHQAWLKDSRLFVHGGFDGKDIFDDLYYLDLAACAYLPQITSFTVELDDE